jgi:benzoyl-CoA 2,3-dioxygenase component B
MPDGMNINYDGLIPNNVDLNADQRVRKALETWHPGYIDWWKDMGPEGFQESLVYLRTAIGVDPKGWAKFDYVKMPEYKCRTARSRSASIRASRPGRKFPVNIAPCCAA